MLDKATIDDHPARQLRLRFCIRQWDTREGRPVPLRGGSKSVEDFDLTPLVQGGNPMAMMLPEPGEGEDVFEFSPFEQIL